MPTHQFSFFHPPQPLLHPNMELTFDQAIELLEITNIHQLKIEDIPQLEKTAKKRWHPDRVSHLNNATITQEYTTKFQQVELACQMVYSYLQGTYQAGQNFSNSEQRVHEEPEDIIRKNAPDLQNELKNSWDFVKKNRYKWTQEEVLLSDGFKLKDLLHEDFEEDLAMLSVISLFFGTIVLGILTVFGAAINSNVGWFVFGIWVLHAISCLFGFAPLSRFWLPQGLANWMVKFVNLGVGKNGIEGQSRINKKGRVVPKSQKQTSLHWHEWRLQIRSEFLIRWSQKIRKSRRAWQGLPRNLRGVNHLA